MVLTGKEKLKITKNTSYKAYQEDVFSMTRLYYIRK